MLTFNFNKTFWETLVSILRKNSFGNTVKIIQCSSLPRGNENSLSSDNHHLIFFTLSDFFWAFER